MPDIRDEQSKDIVETITVWCMCQSPHGFHINKWVDEETFEINWIASHGKSLWGRLRDTWNYFRGKPFEETLLMPEQARQLAVCLLKELARKNNAKNN